MLAKTIKIILNYLTINKNCLIYLKCDDIGKVPELPEINYSIRTMNINSHTDIEHWLEIMRVSFKRSNLSINDFYDSILRHPYYSVIDTFFLVDEEKPIAIISAATFKNNNKIGVIHYIGIHQNYKGQKLGKYIILYALHFLRNIGFIKCEVESFLKHKESIGIHIDFGFKPKIHADAWNTKDNSNFISKVLTKKTLINLYKKLKKE